MLVTFTTNAYENITFFGDVALQLLSLMGESGKVPGALKADQVAEALTHLQQGLSGSNKSEPLEDDMEDKKPQISLSHRALPLVNLLKAAASKNSSVMWVQG